MMPNDENMPEIDDELDFDSEGDLDDDAAGQARRFLTDQQLDENGLYEHFAVAVDKGQS